MLTSIADGVWVHQSACMLTNGTVVQGSEGVLLIDPGWSRAELECLAADLQQLGQPVVAGFATHPHPDHVLWIDALGEVPRYGTAQCAASIRDFLTTPDWQSQVIESTPPEVADDLPLELLGHLDALAEGTTELPWDGPTVRILEHRAHEVGHAALVVGDVLVAGDMLSNRLIPFLDFDGASDPVGDYLAALDLFEGLSASVVVPGHGDVGTDLQARIALDRAYVEALGDAREVVDPRFGPDTDPDWQWVGYIHESQVARFAGASGAEQ